MIPAVSDPDIERYVVVREVDDGKPFADPIFERRYRATAPDFPIHILAFYLAPDGQELPVCYIHFTEKGEILLGGGACVDDRGLRRMSPEARLAVRKTGGLYQHVLSWSLCHLSSRCKAIFGFCGDALAERADLAVGFRRTAHSKLLVHFSQEFDESERLRLIAEAHSVGPF